MALNSKTKPQKTSKVNDLVLSGVLTVINKNDAWSGTMTELNSALTKVVNRKNSELLPGSPSSLRVVLNRIVNRLRNRKVSVKFRRTPDHMRTRYVEFTTR